MRFAHWELALPNAAVDADDEISALVEARHAPSLGATSFAAGVKRMLEAQGCLVGDLPSRLTLRDLFRLVQAERSQLYATYYAHPLWRRLAEGEASTGQLAAWVIHNYHVSRSAGVIAARRAAGARGSEGDAFRRDAIEEYWHCDAFYFVQHPRLPLDAAACKAYVPLPGSTAFEELALHAAGHDALAHLLIAYFQESSIIFRGDSELFYDRVERHYGLGGFFDGWRRHLALDVGHDHVGGLAALFDSDREVARSEIARALRTLRLAHYFLLASLDQASAFAGDAAASVADRQPERFAARAGTRERSASFGPELGESLARAMEDSCFAALGQARCHDDIMVAGRLAALFAGGREEVGETANPWLVAVRNFLLERSGDLGLLLLLLREIALAVPAAKKHGTILDQMVHERRTAPRPVECGQLTELLDLASTASPLAPAVFDFASLQASGAAA